MTKRKKDSGHPGPCPACGEIHPARIQYGYLIWSDDLKEALDRGELALGGCTLGLDDPSWHCIQCGHRWGLSHR